MSREKALIKIIDSVMPKSPDQENRLFEADSEIIPFGSKRMAVNIDEFSEEDMLREHDPFTLGWNLAAGSISDIYAAGGRPAYYSHSLTIRKNWSAEYVRSLSEGIAAVLKEAGVFFLGGDFGKAEAWRYTASVIGELTGNPLLRSGAKAGDGIYITGEIGLGNLEAFIHMYSDNKVINKLTGAVKNRFKLRHRESELIRAYASSCIDTSDGVFSALNAVSEMSGIGYELCDLPYIKLGAVAAGIFSIPRTMLFLGECGEYELLFTVGRELEKDFLLAAEAGKFVFYKIGTVTESKERILHEPGKTIDFGQFDISARDYDDIKEYLKKVLRFLEV